MGNFPFLLNAGTEADFIGMWRGDGTLHGKSIMTQIVRNLLIINFFLGLWLLLNGYKCFKDLGISKLPARKKNVWVYILSNSSSEYHFIAPSPALLSWWFICAHLKRKRKIILLKLKLSTFIQKSRGHINFTPTIYTRTSYSLLKMALHFTENNISNC